MIKLNKQVDALYDVQERIDAKIEKLQDKLAALEEKAADEDREFTAREQDRFYKYMEQIDDLQAEYDEVQNAIDYLIEYCD